MSQALLFIVFRGQEIQMKVKGNSNEFPPKKWRLAHRRGEASLHAHPLYALSKPTLVNLKVFRNSKFT